MRRFPSLACAAFLGLACNVAIAADARPAQTYPTKPIRR